jgi:hypothetical protein
MVAAMDKKPKKKKQFRSGTALGLYIPPEMKEALDRLAERNERSLTAEVIRALRRHLEVEGMPLPEK